MPIHFEIVREGSFYSARPDGDAKFAVGQRVHYQDNVGLANDNSALARQFNYSASTFQGPLGFWTDFIEPTAFCEGRSFITLNTYDRARFTFGFAQFGAHVPDGDFVTWFRDMLGQPEAAEYFPDLEVQNGRIVKVGATGATPLESQQTTKPLMDYLNPSLGSIEDEEVIAAAKLIHWTMKHPQSQELQVKQMIATGHAILMEADRRIGLDGVSADVCCIIMDIRHQGRGTFAEMLNAKRASDPFKSLLAIGAIPYADRIKTLKSALQPRRAAFSKKKWNRLQKEFV